MEPTADRPNIPYGILPASEGAGLMPWSRVEERMRSAYIYWVATVTTEGRPHAVPVWGVWLDGTLYFSNGPTTTTGRALAKLPEVSVHLESGEDAVIIEGSVEAATDAALVGRINDAYMPKYLWKDRMNEGWYALRPRIAFAWLCPSAGVSESVYASTATRWRFT